MGKEDKTSCIFCRIIDKKVPAEIIYEDENVLVVMDKFPAMRGQVLLIVKKHVPYVFDFPDKDYSKALLAAKKIARAMDKSLGSERTCLLIEGFEVPHTHIKLFPTYGDGLRIHGGEEAEDSNLNQIARDIKSVL